MIASRTTSRRNGSTCVCTARRSRGGVSMTETSRRPSRPRLRVRGIGVADIASTSTLALERLQPLLLRHPEALLLVDDEQAEVAEAHVLGEQAVGADDDVHRALGDARDHLLLLGGGDEARQPADLDREPGEAARERADVLLGENRGRRQHRHLLAVHHRLERRAHRDLGLAVADVADHAGGPSGGATPCRASPPRSPAPGRRSARTRTPPRTRAATASPWRTRSPAASSRVACTLSSSSAMSLSARLTLDLVRDQLVAAQAVERGGAPSAPAYFSSTSARSSGTSSLPPPAYSSSTHSCSSLVERERAEAGEAADAVVGVHDEVADREVAHLGEHAGERPALARGCGQAGEVGAPRTRRGPPRGRRSRARGARRRRR